MNKRELIDFRQAVEYVWNKSEKKKIAVLSTTGDDPLPVFSTFILFP